MVSDSPFCGWETADVLANDWLADIREEQNEITQNPEQLNGWYALAQASDY
ncbi:hypothetical protein [Aurantivibrio plasticivorans]